MAAAQIWHVIKNNNPAYVIVPRRQSEMEDRITDLLDRNSPQIGNNF